MFTRYSRQFLCLGFVCLFFFFSFVLGVLCVDKTAEFIFLNFGKKKKKKAKKGQISSVKVIRNISAYKEAGGRTIDGIYGRMILCFYVKAELSLSRPSLKV